MSPFEQSRASLSTEKSYGVWSLIVTIFGDMVQGPDDRVSGAALTAICEKLRIKPQSMRVALHRLRKDGWIDSVKTGRRSAYFLTPASRVESAEASQRIYASDAPEYTGVSLLIDPTFQPSLPWIPVSADISVSFTPAGSPSETAIVTHHAGPLPQWLTKSIVSDAIAAEFRDLHRRLVSVKTEHLGDLSPPETAALRVLIVHDWRRMVLKFPALPDEVFGSQCQISECRARVFALLEQLPKPDLSKLENQYIQATDSR